MTGSLDLDSIEVRDGMELHHSVPPNSWCVTREDLIQFRDLVSKHVAEGKITPTELDRFDPADTKIGPCVHTVNIQLIRPVTDKAGKMSWALMLHPGGLKCDLFVTHCWQEGVYEFIDKVLHSWPRGARHAYCCMLSNPQSLDVGGLISNPRESPFAQALESASYMMVVPNQRCSIYSRVWCAYEAFLAYSQGKYIFTATAPVPELGRHVLFMLSATLAAFLVGALLFSQEEIKENGGWGDDSFELLAIVDHICMLVTACTMLLAANLRPSVITLLLLCMGALSSGTQAALTSVQYFKWLWFGHRAAAYLVNGAVHTCVSIFVCTVPALASADRLWSIQAECESRDLSAGYKGRLRDAESFVMEDKVKILKELEESGEEDRVNDAVRVLIDAGASTPTLRLAQRQVQKLKRAFHWSLSNTMFFWVVLILYPSLVISTGLYEYWHTYSMFYNTYIDIKGECVCGRDHPCDSFPSVCGQCSLDFSGKTDWLCNSLASRWDFWVCLLGVVEALAWPVLFICLDRDKRGFASSAIVKIMGACVWLWLIPLFLDGTLFEENSYGVFVSFLFAVPLVFILSAAGPGQTAGVRWLGPLLVRCLIGRVGCSCRCCCRRAVAEEVGPHLAFRISDASHQSRL